MPMLMPALRAFLSLTLLLLPSLARAEKPEPCPRLTSSAEPSFIPAALAANQLGLTYIGHATFLIETPGGVRIATDYNDYVRPSVIPDVVTMNKAHSTHYTNHPDPGIKLVLRGWNPAGGPIRYDETFGDVRIRNVQTNIRTGDSSTEYNGNSIFVFEAAGLCIAHLGHLHHELTPEHLAKLGRIDVVLAPVDGSYTLDTPGMMNVLKAIDAPLVIPMHIFSDATLERFLSLARENYTVEFSPTAHIVLSRDRLPASPKVLVLPGR
jgi:L-ascorbate metabolism protein UlaG (beta-lactamase superfamily)